MKPTSPNLFKNSCFRHNVEHIMLQPKTLTTLAHAIGYMLQEEFDRPCNILIATDTRPSSPSIKKAIIQGLLDFDHDVFDGNIAPTPCVAKAVKDYQPEDQDNDDHNEETSEDEPFFDLGIVITASHNPAEFNGIKIVTPFGYLDIDTEEYISNIFHKLLENSAHLKHIKPDDNQATVTDFDLTTWYQMEIMNQVHIEQKNVSILLDCANGASNWIASKIFQACGYQTIAINHNTSQPINLNSGCQNPTMLLEHIRTYNTTWGCAFDGDADRVIIAHKNGTIFDGDDILAVLQKHEKYADNEIFIGTIMSNQGLQDYFKTIHKKFLRTAVGERNVINALIQNQTFLGAETCGHIIMMDHAFCGDGMLSALLFLETINTKNIPPQRLFHKYPQVHKNIHINNGCNETKLLDLEKKYNQSSAPSRVVIRLSNTEPMMRIMTESPTQDQAESVMNQIIKDIKEGNIVYGF